MSVLLVALAMQFILPDDGAAPREGTLQVRRSRHGCGADAGAEVVVCGDRASRYRLPLPHERDVDGVRRLHGEVPAALDAITPAGRCGIFAGERRCGRAEAARYGYGGGRDPITLLSKLGRTLVSPDSEP